MRADEIADRDREDLKPLQIYYNDMKKRSDYLLEYKKECEESQQWETLSSIKIERNELRVKMKQIGSVISSSQYSIKWLEDGREPGNRREIGRRSRYQRTILMESLEQFTEQVTGQKPIEMSTEDIERFNETMNCLTDREREAILLVRGSEFSFQSAAKYMKVAKGTVQNLVARAENKLDSAKEFGFQINLF